MLEDAGRSRSRDPGWITAQPEVIPGQKSGCGKLDHSHASFRVIAPVGRNLRT